MFYLDKRLSLDFVDVLDLHPHVDGRVAFGVRLQNFLQSEKPYSNLGT